MTTEPKFVLNEAIEITVKDNIKVRVKLVDCVGYTVEVALGYQKQDGSRMVLIPSLVRE